MVQISKLKNNGCCANCPSEIGEKDIYGIDVGCYRVDMCKDCFPKFVKEINEAYTKMFERKE